MAHLVLLLLALLATIDESDAAVLHVPVKKVVSTSTAVMSFLPSYEAFQRAPVYEPFRERLVDDNWEDHADVPIHNYLGSMYVGEIHLGSPPQVFTIAFDVVSSDLWVPNRKFSRNHIYNHTKSTTYKANGTWVDMDVIAGTVSEDLLHLGSLQVPNINFIEINQTKIRDIFAFGKFDGILGVGFDALSAAHMDSSFHQIVRSGALDEPVVAFYLKDHDDGIVTFGGVEHNHFQGDLTYVDVVASKYWGFALDAVKVGDAKVTTGGTAIVISTPFIFGPKNQIAAVASAIGAKEIQSGVYSISCVAPAHDIVFMLNGKEFALSVRDYIIHYGSSSECLWAFAGTDKLPIIDTWMLGDTFVRKFYTVLDYGTDTRKPRVGFAPAMKTP